MPSLLIDTWVAADRREQVMAVLAAVKNPTVIAFTFVWMDLRVDGGRGAADDSRGGDAPVVAEEVPG
ncbi:MAG: hypothetical protein GEV11_11895 [Streptosporangiales bacterium]|nr:hypothetical protein [Streptosporangiales bacterium]